jgi:hypothetical protein
MATLKKTPSALDRIFFCVSYLLWVLTFVGYLFPLVLRLGLGTEIVVSLNFLFFLLTLLTGSRAFRVGVLSIFFGSSVVIFGGWVMIVLIQTMSYRGEGVAAAMIVSSYYFMTLIYLAFQAVSCIVFLFLLNRSSERRTRAFVAGALCFIVLNGLSASWTYMRNQNFIKQFCTGESGGLYNDFFFLKPLSKSEVGDILQNGIDIQRMMLTKDPLDYSGTLITFGDFYNGQRLTHANAAEKVITLIDPYTNHDYEETFSTGTVELLDAFDRGEPVVWYVEVADTPMTKLIPFAKRLDLEEHRLGIYMSEDGKREIYYPTVVRDIQPQNSSEFIWQAKCYSYYP